MIRNWGVANTMDRQTRDRAVRAGLYVILAIVLVFLLLPIYWMVNTSIKFGGEVAMFPQTYWPRRPTTENYTLLWTEYRWAGTFATTN